jgi:hypothetical protein
MVSNFEIVKKIHGYVKGDLDLGSFRDWIVQAQIELENDEGSQKCAVSVKTLLGEVEGRYGELVQGVVSVEEWKKRIESLIVPAPKTAESAFLTYFYSTSTLNPEILNKQAERDVASVPNFAQQEVLSTL